MNRLEELYHTEIRTRLVKELNLESLYQAPSLEKVVVNSGIGKAVQDKKEIETALADLRLITGQQPVITKAKRSISSFSLRQGTPIGAKITLRGHRMYEFLDKLFNIVLPRTRDFHGLDLKGFDGQGNYSLGLPEQAAFPEIDPTQIRKPLGLQIVIVTNANDDSNAELLLRKLGCPLKKRV